MTPAELKSARRQLGLTQAGLARVVGVHVGRTIGKWECGERSIPGTVAVLLNLALISQEARRHLGLRDVLID